MNNILIRRVGDRARVMPSGCWEWTGATTHSYGSVAVGNKKTAPTHRVVYGNLVYPLKTENQVHHLCENSLCLNPSHLYHTENIQHHQKLHRKRLCPKGHALDGDNLVTIKRRRIDERRCVQCHREQALVSWHKHKP